MILGFCRSSGVIERMIASTRARSRSSMLTSRKAEPAPGSIARMSLSGPIRFSIWNCSRKSSSVNWPFSILRAAFSASCFVEVLLSLFDEAEHVAHAEDPARHPIRVEGLESLEAFPESGELDRHAGDFPH
jgi:hypothetical protein